MVVLVAVVDDASCGPGQREVEQGKSLGGACPDLECLPKLVHPDLL